MSKDIKKALEHCIEWNCADCPNREELGSGETVCRGRLLPYVLEYVSDLEAKLAEKDKAIENWQTMYESVMQTCHNDKEEIERLREQIALTEKALELACERVKYFEEMQDKEMGFSEFFGYDSDYDLKAIIEQYKEYAKEMMESE